MSDDGNSVRTRTCRSWASTLREGLQGGRIRYETVFPGHVAEQLFESLIPEVRAVGRATLFPADETE